MNGLIGYTGFVGGNLDKQFRFDIRYNSSNIDEIQGEDFNILVCAGVSGIKWIANKYPNEDLQKINNLLNNLSKVSCKKMILISTVDVYVEPNNADENTNIRIDGLHPYGKNRVKVERFIQNSFENVSIIRLPAIYGEGLKKNFVFDLLNNHCLEWTHRDSVFQYYHLKNLWKDIRVVIEKNIPIINFNSEPVSAKELAKECFEVDFENVTERLPLNYDIRSIHSNLFNEGSNYMYSKNQVFEEMRKFIKKYTRRNLE
ncbi:NAD(P)-dependent oxidoreductase [Sporosalibacterium faouarense]|uniref:NAD(P)-dependent oxidoreductase n=1 Tax=Sporosalibacterium faouarense TaxID=516123 RepID=UPI00192B5BCC|nr:NAD(P)-dependent oxidoreductase [Sporosalibacterium faouarense]